MNKILLLINVYLFFISTLTGQILPVPLVIQEQNQWCWVAVSKCALDYYGQHVTQCTIAEYTRNTAIWHDYGSQNCCDFPDGACNYWNYDWGYSGSIGDILKHFGNIQFVGKSDSLGINEISEEIKNSRPFIFRWVWTSGGGHFLIGHGMDQGMLYYMNPWPGEGFKMAMYDWVVSGSDHKWRNAMKLRTNYSGIDNNNFINQVIIYPNPSNGLITIEMNPDPGEYSIEIINVFGQMMYSQNFNNLTNQVVINLTDLPNGFYLINIIHDGSCKSEKILINH